MRKPAYTNKVNRGINKVVVLRELLQKTVFENTDHLDAKVRDDIRTAIRWIAAQHDWYNNKG